MEDEGKEDLGEEDEWEKGCCWEFGDDENGGGNVNGG